MNSEVYYRTREDLLELIASKCEAIISDAEELAKVLEMLNSLKK